MVGDVWRCFGDVRLAPQAKRTVQTSILQSKPLIFAEFDWKLQFDILILTYSRETGSTDTAKSK